MLFAFCKNSQHFDVMRGTFDHWQRNQSCSFTPTRLTFNFSSSPTQRPRSPPTAAGNSVVSTSAAATTSAAAAVVLRRPLLFPPENYVL
jgi:hypothetical protein